jgi:hypothetical protein
MAEAQMAQDPETQPLLSSLDVPHDHDLQHQPDHHHGHHYHIDMNTTIYSAIVYGPGVARIKTGNGNSKTTRLVCSLILLNMIIQVGLLRLMYIFSHRDAPDGRIYRAPNAETKLKKQFMKAYETFLTPQEQEVVTDAESSKNPMCVLRSNGTYLCTAPGVHFTSDWNLLDINGDGMWQLSEATVTEENTGTMAPRRRRKKTTSSAPASAKNEAIANRRTNLFNNIIRGFKQRSEWLETFNQTLYLSQDILTARAIPKAYFDYWVGDAMICSRTGSAACESIVKSGLFDAAFERGRLAAAHKGIFDYNSAASYCRMMLEDHGGCEQSLPSEFRAWTSERSGMCGEVSLEDAGILTNRRNPLDVMPVLAPAYERLEAEKQACHPTFLFFTILIMYLFFASLVDELRDLIKTTDFLCSFPGIRNALDRGGEDLGEDAKGADEDAEKRYRIQRISKNHRAVLLLVLFIRIFIFAMLTSFGTWFLLNEVGYMELVLNAVSLSFITGIDEMMYDIFMEKGDKDAIGFDDSKRLTYSGFIGRHPKSFGGMLFRKDFWGLFFIPVITAVVVLWNLHYVRQPIVAALSCSCLQEGQTCAESIANQGPWWENYWTHTLPAAVHQIQAMSLTGA